MNGRLAVTLAAATLLSSTPLHAATMARQWQLTPFAGFTQFNESDVSQPIQARKLEDAPYFGGRLGYQFTRNFGIEAAGGMMNTKVDTTGGIDVDLWHLAGDVLLSAPLGDPADVFLLAGAGKASASAGDEDRSSTTFEVGAGVRWWLKRGFALRLEARNISPSNKNSPVHNAVVYGAGLTFGFGGAAPDADGDKVADAQDKCPNTPTGAAVDATGCPLDGDGDGIYDGLDACSGTPSGAHVDARGCPVDGDADGVPDGIDQCANTTAGAPVDARGCPIDSDQDGIPDGTDKCANTPTGAMVSADGCPMDDDKDGVPNGLDKCPQSVAGVPVDATGCTVVNQEMHTELMDTGKIRVSNINFASGKTEIQPESYAVLNEVGAVLAHSPDLKYEIGGHTDSRGTASLNKKLSTQRATAVRDYLLKQFPTLKAEQFVVKGYGESKPLVKETNAANMAKNRRVEFVVLK